MKIGLIDVDSHNFPNLALMKVSGWFKNHGATVEWCNRMEHYDVVFMSKVFDETYTPDIEWEPNADIIVKGGTGYIRGDEVYKNGTWVKRHDIQVGKELYQDVLPTHVEHEYPDYSLYPELTKDTAYGYLTRGCPRACEFCLVAEKEGKASRKVAELSEFWRGAEENKTHGSQYTGVP